MAGSLYKWECCMRLKMVLFRALWQNNKLLPKSVQTFPNLQIYHTYNQLLHPELHPSITIPEARKENEVIKSNNTALWHTTEFKNTGMPWVGSYWPALVQQLSPMRQINLSNFKLHWLVLAAGVWSKDTIPSL